jgi:hypothetical protein
MQDRKVLRTEKEKRSINERQKGLDIGVSAFAEETYIGHRFI